MMLWKLILHPIREIERRLTLLRPSYNYTIDLNNRIEPIGTVPVIKQRDIKTNLLNINIKKDRKDFDLNGLTTTVTFLKPDNTLVIKTTLDANNPLEVTDNLIKCLLPSSILTDVGEVVVEVALSKQDKLLHSKRVLLTVIESMDNDLIIADDPDLPVLQSLIAEVNELKEQGFNLTFKTWNELVNGKVD